MSPNLATPTGEPKFSELLQDRVGEDLVLNTYYEDRTNNLIYIRGGPKDVVLYSVSSTKDFDGEWVLKGEVTEDLSREWRAIYSIESYKRLQDKLIDPPLAEAEGSA